MRIRRPVLTVYLIGLFQGLALVALPAAATILQSPSAYDLSSSQYGLLFLPQVMTAILGALTVPALARRFSLARMLSVGLVANTAAMALVLASAAVDDQPVAYPMLLLATAALGLGFGVTLSCISTYAGSFAPDRREVALTSLNVLLGLGTALSPLLVALFVGHAEWWYLPLLTAAGLGALLVSVAVAPLGEPAAGDADQGGPRSAGVPRAFWVFAAALVAYGIGETMFGNWGTTLLVDAGATATDAGYALAAFWAAVTVGRLLIALTARRVRSTTVYVVLPWAIAGALLLASQTTGDHGVLLFAFGGFACSGFFPMTIGFGEAAFPADVERSAGWLVAAYQVGYGLAAFGGGALQRAVALSSLFAAAAVIAVLMGLLAPVIARRSRSVGAR